MEERFKLINSASSVVNSESLNVNNVFDNLLSNTCTASEKKIENIQVTLTPANKEQITG